MASVKAPMKWLILGADGQLGRAMQAELMNSGVDFLSRNHSQLDITNEDEIARVFEEVQPDVVLNSAAWTDVDGAEAAEGTARLINAHGPLLLAKACSTLKAKFAHISTDYVFSGNSMTPWQEDSALGPISAYGRTKAEGESLVRDCYPHGTFIVRTAWLYSPWKKNFAKTMVRLALKETGSVKVVNDQVGQPTSAMDLASQIQLMINRDAAPGIYHGTNSGQASWFEFAQHIFELLGANVERVIPVDTKEFPRPATRPKYSVLGHQHWINEGLTEMRDWHQALEMSLPAIIDAVSLGD